jgi:hypothetical protein
LEFIAVFVEKHPMIQSKRFYLLLVLAFSFIIACDNDELVPIDEVSPTGEPLIQVTNNTGIMLMEVLFRDSIAIGHLEDGQTSRWVYVENVWCYAHHQITAINTETGEEMSSQRWYCGNDPCLYTSYDEGRYRIILTYYDDQQLSSEMNQID